MKKPAIFVLALIFSICSNIIFIVNSEAARTIERVSVDNAGAEGNGGAIGYPHISGDGRYVTFSSTATNLVAGDTNGAQDIFVYDRTLDTIERVSVDNAGAEGNGASNDSYISSDGRYVGFWSNATNLVAGDTNGVGDVFVYDRTLDTIERVSVDDNGVQGNMASGYPSISSDGRYVAFFSYASNLVAGDTNGVSDVFVYDRTLDTIERVSVNDAVTQGNAASNAATYPSISSNGRYVAFSSTATNLVAGDTNGSKDIFVYDRDTDTIERVSVDSNGVESNGGQSWLPWISSDGRYVVFASDATNLVAGDTNAKGDIFLYDRDNNTTIRVSIDNNGVEGDNNSFYPVINSDGCYIAFHSLATNLVSGDTNADWDVFIYDQTLATIERVSVDNNGVEGNDGSDAPRISPDGRYIALRSLSTNLVAGDTNTVGDIFVSFSPVCTSAVAEISPVSVYTSAQDKAFSYYIEPTISAVESGIDKIDITVPATYSDINVTGVGVGGAFPAYTDNSAGNTISVTLTTKVTTDGIDLLVNFTADTPTAADAGVNFTSTVDDTSNPSAVNTASGDGDGGGGITTNTWTVIASVYVPSEDSSDDLIACFIATAAYGTPMAEEVKALSRFRDQHLLTNKPGREFVKFYYKYGPAWADYIKDKESLKKIVRVTLKPFVWMSESVTKRK